VCEASTNAAHNNIKVNNVHHIISSFCAECKRIKNIHKLSKQTSTASAFSGILSQLQQVNVSGKSTKFKEMTMYSKTSLQGIFEDQKTGTL